MRVFPPLFTPRYVVLLCSHSFVVVGLDLSQGKAPYTTKVGRRVRPYRARGQHVVARQHTRELGADNRPEDMDVAPCVFSLLSLTLYTMTDDNLFRSPYWNGCGQGARLSTKPTL